MSNVSFKAVQGRPDALLIKSLIPTRRGNFSLNMDINWLQIDCVKMSILINCLFSDMHNRNSPNAYACPKLKRQNSFRVLKWWKLKGVSKHVCNSGSPFRLRSSFSQLYGKGIKSRFYIRPRARAFFPNNKFSHEHKQFVASAIKELLRVGSVLECPAPPTIVNPLFYSASSPMGKSVWF